MRRCFPTSIVLAALLTGATACASGAYVPPPSPRLETLPAGERVRVEYVPHGGDARRVSGRLLRSDVAGVRLVADQLDTVTVARAELRELWVSRGVQPRAAPVAAGALLGFVTGLLAISAWVDDDAGRDDRGGFNAAVVFGSAAAGALIGASATSTDYWVRVPLR